MTERRTLLAVHAHPDDEAIGTGGTLAKAAAAGIHTVLVCATRGEVGEIHDPDLDPEDAKERLGEIREGELRRACAILGVAELHFLGYRDSGMAGTPDNADPRNFHNADPDEATGRLVRVLRQARPQVVITYNERGGYGHPDHIAVHRATLAAVDAAADPARYPEDGLPPWRAAKLYYAAWPLSDFLRLQAVLRERGFAAPFAEADFDPAQFTVPDDQITTRIDVRAFGEAKREAMRVHRTQLPAEHFAFSLPDDLTREMFGIEHFSLARTTVATTPPEDDLFAGLPS